MKLKRRQAPYLIVGILVIFILIFSILSFMNKDSENISAPIHPSPVSATSDDATSSTEPSKTSTDDINRDTDYQETLAQYPNGVEPNNVQPPAQRIMRHDKTSNDIKPNTIQIPTQQNDTSSVQHDQAGESASEKFDRSIKLLEYEIAIFTQDIEEFSKKYSGTQSSTTTYRDLAEQHVESFKNQIQEILESSTDENRKKLAIDKIQQILNTVHEIKAIIISDIIASRADGAIIDTGGVNTYPWRERCPQDNLRFMTASGYGCQSVSYAGYKVYEVWGFSPAWGDSKNWGNGAMAAGFRVDDNPEPYTVGYSTSGAYGHVVWVESVNDNGTINLSEYDYVYGDYSYRAGVPVSAYRYIHFDTQSEK